MRTRLRGGHADRAGKRLVVKLNASGEDDPAPLGIYLRDPEPRLRELVSQEAESRDECRPSPLPRPKLKDVHGQYIAGLGTSDVHGPADRVYVVEVQLGDILGVESALICSSEASRTVNSTASPESISISGSIPLSQT